MALSKKAAKRVAKAMTGFLSGSMASVQILLNRMETAAGKNKSFQKTLKRIRKSLMAPAKAKGKILNKQKKAA